MTRITPAMARGWLPRRAPDAHKGDFGHVLVVAGSRGMTGAAALAARAALRAGAGLVTVAGPRDVALAVAAQAAECLTLALPETAVGTLSVEAGGKIQLAQRERGYRTLALGPGLSTHPETARAVVGILGSLGLPAVVDADALNVLSRQPREAVRKLLARRGAPTVLTPHPGEAARLLGVRTADVQADRAGAARRIAEELGVACLLKGRATIVTDGTRAYVNPTGNPGLAKGGTGDVLTGVIAALWSQRLGASGAPGAEAAESGLAAAALGAYLHGLAADLAAREKTAYALLAGDVIEALPAAFRRVT